MIPYGQLSGIFFKTQHGSTKLKGLGQTVSFGAPGRNKKAQYLFKVSGNHEFNLVGPIDSSLHKIGPPGAVQRLPGPPKGPSGANTEPFFWGSQNGPTHDMDAAHPVGPNPGIWAVGVPKN